MASTRQILLFYELQLRNSLESPPPLINPWCLGKVKVIGWIKVALALMDSISCLT